MTAILDCISKGGNQENTFDLSVGSLDVTNNGLIKGTLTVNGAMTVASLTTGILTATTRVDTPICNATVTNSDTVNAFVGVIAPAATIATLNSTTGNITTVAATTVGATTGNIVTVNSTTGNITTVAATTVGATTGNITTINGTTGTITTINGTTGNITTVNATTVGATTGNITTINGTTGNITTLVGTTGNITTVNSTTVNSTTVNANAIAPLGAGILDVGIVRNLGVQNIGSLANPALTLFSTLGTVGTLTSTTGNITTVNATTGNITTVAATTVGATTGNITTVNATTVGATTGNIVTVAATTVGATTGNITTVNATTVGATTGNITTVNATTVNSPAVYANTIEPAGVGVLNVGLVNNLLVTNVGSLIQPASTLFSVAGKITTLTTTQGNILTVTATDVGTTTCTSTNSTINGQLTYAKLTSGTCTGVSLDATLNVANLSLMTANFMRVEGMLFINLNVIFDVTVAALQNWSFDFGCTQLNATTTFTNSSTYFGGGQMNVAGAWSPVFNVISKDTTHLVTCICYANTSTFTSGRATIHMMVPY
jgi:hypothetical protein